MLSVQFELDETHAAASLVALIADVHTAITDRAEALIPKEPPTTRSAAPTEYVPDVVRLYEHMAENESPRFLEVLTDEPLTFEELAERMASNGGAELEVASMRAITATSTGARRS